MKIKGSTYNNWTIEFIYSPFFELLCSLHVLFNPSHHKNREQWAIDMKKRMNKDLYGVLKTFDEISDAYLGAMEFRYLDDVFHEVDIIQSIDALGDLKTETFAYLMMNKKMSPASIDTYRTKGTLEEDLSDQLIAFLRSIERHQRTFIAALKEYYYLYFQTDLLSLEPYLIRSIQAHKGLSEKMGILDYISILHPRIEVLEDRLSLHKYKRFDFMLDEIKGLDIGISSFIDPHLLMGEDDGILSLCIRAKLEKLEDAVHDDLLLLLKALADKTRLKIVKLLYDQPRCTQELSLIIDISEAGISKQLKTLMNAKIVKKIRKGNYMVYYLDKEIIDRIPMNIYQYLDEKVQ